MRRSISILGVLFLAPAMVCAHSKTIHSKVLVRAMAGSGKGEVYLTDPELGQPRSFVVTNNEQIYLLDTYNNRVLHFDANGKLLEAIPIRSTRLTTAKDRKEDPMLGKRVVLAEYLLAYKGSIYASQWLKTDGPPHLLKLRGDSFVNDDTDKYAKKILRLLDGNPFRGERLSSAIALGGTFKAEIDRLQRGPGVFDALIDKDKNLWVLTMVENRVKPSDWVLHGIRVIDQSGRTVYRTDLPWISDAVSEAGNLFVMSYIWDKTAPVSPERGVEITKYTLH